MTLTTTGFTRKRLSEIKADYDTAFTDALGPINTAPDAVVGQVIGIFAAALDDAYEALQNTYDAMYPYSAEGTSLDGSVAFVGLTRREASATTVNAICYGAESTLIPAGSLTRTIAGAQFASGTDTVISRSSAGDIELEVTTVTNAGNYQVIAGGTSVVYTADMTATGAEIAAGLAALFNPANYLATASGSKLRIRAADQYSDFTLTHDSKMTITRLGTPVVFTALQLGDIVCPSLSLTTIDSPIVGWDEVTNLVQGATGVNMESDEELRLRHASALSVTGAATLGAIKSRILEEVDSVTAVNIYENRSINVVDSMPSHSFECVVVGGNNQSIANKIYEVKPAGIETYGNTSVQVTDSNGDVQIVKFTRSTAKYAWIRVSVNTLYPEETLTTAVVSSIQIAVKAYGDTLAGGEDIIVQRFYGPIYNATSGIGSITVEVAVTDGPTDAPTYSTSNIAIGRANYALFDTVRISVLGV